MMSRPSNSTWLRMLLLGCTLLLLTQCDKISQSRAESHYQAGVAKHQNQQMHDAITEYGRTLALNPDHLEARLYRAHALVTLNELEAALDDYDMLLTVSPAHLQAHAGRAHVQAKLGKLDEALVTAEQAAKLYPDKVLPLLMTMELKRKLGDHTGAIHDADLALNLEPENAEALINRSAAREAMGDQEGALADINKALELEEQPSARAQRAFFHMIRQQWAEAADDLRRAGEASENADRQHYYHFFLWVARHRLGEGKAADTVLAEFRDASRSDNIQEWTREIAAFLVDQQGEEDLIARAASDEPNKERDQKCEAWYYVAEKRLAKGDKAGARAAFENCVATQQKDFYEYMCAVSALRHLDD